MKKKVYNFLIALFLLAACTQHDKVKRKVSEGKMVEVLTRIYLLKGYDMLYQEVSFDDLEVLNHVLKEYEVDSADYRSTMDFYSLKPKKNARLYDKVIQEIKKIEGEKK